MVSTSTKSEVSRTEAALSGRVDGVEEKFGKELHEVQEEMQKGVFMTYKLSATRRKFLSGT